MDLFAGVAVTDHDAAVGWWEQLLGSPASFQAHATESVWVLAEHVAVYVVERPADAGHGLLTVMVDDLDAFLAAAAEHGLEPTDVEHYDNDVRKAVFHDPDHNEIGIGEVPGGE